MSQAFLYIRGFLTGSDNVSIERKHYLCGRGFEIEKLDKPSRIMKYKGSYTASNPVSGSRVRDLFRLQKHHDIFSAYQKEVYHKQKLDIIPRDRLEEANAISKKMFEAYISKYKQYGITVDTGLSNENHYNG